MSRYTVPDGPKMLRESLCVAQTQIGHSDDPRKAEHIARLGRLIKECDRHRPLGPDGKHGDQHTTTCGCGSVVSDLERAQEWLGCERYQEKPLVSNCWTHVPGQPKMADLTWPCSEATRLAALLAETRAES